MAEPIHDAQRLKELQELPLYRKIQITQTRIIEWYQHYGGKVYVSFSGGKDSTALLDICRKMYPNIPAVFSNTGLEYPEIQSFVKKHDNVKIVRPKMQFSEVISTYGYPLIGKEVAGAIYYARRIHTHTHTMRQKRGELCGTRQRSGRSCTGDGSEADGVARETEAKRTSRGEWQDWRRGCL